MAQHQNEKEALLCTYGDCQNLQIEDGEFCEQHIGGNRVDMADICELAHELTSKYCLDTRKTLEYKASNGDIRYTEEAQDKFNEYYDLITNTFKI